MRDIHNHLSAIRAISPVSVSNDTAQVSQVADLQGYNACELTINIGSVADADATFTLLVEESNDNSTFTSVGDDDLLGTEALASFAFDSDNTCRKIGYVGNKRYVRATITPANNTGAALMSAMWLLGHPMHGPVGNPSSVND